MREILAEVRAGRFSDMLLEEKKRPATRASGSARQARNLPVEQARKKLID
jgi:ketol-acid reductoisomerase